jgi:hypothetical protein
MLLSRGRGFAVLDYGNMMREKYLSILFYYFESLRISRAYGMRVCSIVLWLFLIYGLFQDGIDKIIDIVTI